MDAGGAGPRPKQAWHGWRFPPGVDRPANRRAYRRPFWRRPPPHATTG